MRILFVVILFIAALLLWRSSVTNSTNTVEEYYREHPEVRKFEECREAGGVVTSDDKYFYCTPPATQAT